jgi:Domain of unknown function (DUF4394)/PEP-CTERM motif
MSCPLCFLARACGACAVALTLGGISLAQTGFGVDANGSLFRFDVTAPGSIPTTTIGNVGFVPEGIDFRPGTNSLYAIDIGPVTSQLYTININTAAATPVGAGFASVVAGSYDLSVNQRFGFDFNPSTLQADNSMRIRLVSTANENLRLNSSTGLVAASDTDLLIQPGGSSPFVDGAAYMNNVPNMGTFATTLYDMDSRNDSLYTQSPPNNGQLNLVGPFGVTIDANSGIGFDIYTVPNDADVGLGGDSGYAVLTRNATQSGAYLLYQVNLATGGISNGKLVGPVGTPADFTGGFSIAPLAIPEPATLALVLIGLAACGAIRRGR